MEKATREKLAKIAKDMAQVPFHGDVDGMASNLASIVRLFPTWNLREADGLWCAAFVYYCCMAAGFEIPYRPEECKTCHLAGCLGWEEFAVGDRRIEYHEGPEGYVPEAEGNVNNISRIIERSIDEHIRAYIRIPDGYRYREE